MSISNFVTSPSAWRSLPPPQLLTAISPLHLCPWEDQRMWPTHSTVPDTATTSVELHFCGTSIHGALLPLGVFWCHCLFHMRAPSLFCAKAEMLLVWPSSPDIPCLNPYQGGASQVLLAGGAQLPHGKAREPKQAEFMADLSWRMGGCRGQSQRALPCWSL